MLKIEQEKVIALLKPTVIAATATTGSAIAVSIFEDDAIAVLQVGTPAGTATALAVTIETSVTTSGGAYTTVGTFTPAVTAVTGEAAVGVNLAGANFVRAKIAMTGADTTTSLPISICLVGNLDYQASTLNSATVA